MNELRLFDLETDSGERQDVAAAHPDDADRLLRLLEATLSATPRPRAADEVEMDETTLRALRSLGYVR